MPVYKIVEFLTVDGCNPFREWLETLDNQTAARIQQRITRLEQGNFGHIRGVGEGVSELKIHFGSGYRVYFGLKERTVVLLLIGGDKKSQFKDIDLAKKYWKYSKEN